MASDDLKPREDLSYRLVVPSRGRPQNMARIQSLLPTATIVVAEDEKERYLQEVDASKLVTHPGAREGIEGLPKVYNWLQENFTEDVLVEADDDLQNVFAWTGEGSRKVWTKLVNPADILQIIENGVQIAIDLDLTTFSWSKTGNAAFAQNDHKPIKTVGLVANVFGVRGAARHRPYDPDMIGRTSVDWTLRTLLDDRVVMIDRRVFFDCGEIFGGTGGNSGMVTTEKYKLATTRLKERWGRHVSFGGSAGGGASKHAKRDKKGNLIGNDKGDRQVSIRVSRSNPAAQK